MGRGLVVIRGAGDLATGVAHRLHRAGFGVIMTDVATPTVIRRTVAFAQAILSGQWIVEGVTAMATVPEQAINQVEMGRVAVVIDPEALIIRQLQPLAVIDAIMAKRNLGTDLQMAPVVIGLGPGFAAGQDVHAVVETQRGHYLGMVLLEGSAAPNTGIPGEIMGFKEERVIRAPVRGQWLPHREIGEMVVIGELIAEVDRQPVSAPISGVLRGMLAGGLPVEPGMKVGDIDPRGQRDYCFTISDKARSVAGGVLEALLLLTTTG